MQLCKQTGLSAGRPMRSSQQGPRASCPAARVQQVRGSCATAGAGSDEIYIGFPKNDYAPREGRKGRFIKDDPNKYPAKDDMGLFIGATGGWAGGEAALVKLRESIKEEIASKATEKPASKKAAAAAPKPGQEEIYVGFGKDELELRKTGVKGRVIYDDVDKYPAKEDIGFLSGATGGFAGGERGIKGFVATGEVKVRKAGEPGGQPMSPLTTAFLVLIAGAGAAVLLSQFYPAGEAMPGLEELELNIVVGGVALLVVSGGLLLKQFLQAQQRSQERQ